MESTRRAQGGARAYAPPEGHLDEAFAAPGKPREAYASVLDVIASGPPSEHLRRLRERASRDDLTFDGHAFRLDPIPRIVAHDEWQRLEAALCQRARALEAFVDDAYGERRIVKAGVVPARVIETCGYFEPRLAGVRVPGRRLAVIGFDVVRDEHGDLHVLEDNLRTPSGIVYALAAREIWGEELAKRAGYEVAPVAHAIKCVGEALRQADPECSNATVVLTHGAGGAFIEHERVARELALGVYTPVDLVARDGAVWTPGGERIGIVYRRTDEDRLWDADSGAETELGAVLGDAVLRGSVAVVNAFGSGVGDDKLTHGYVERMIRFYLSEDPLIRSVPSVDFDVPGEPAGTLANLDEMVVKPREGEGGTGVAVPGEIDAGEREQLRRALRANHEGLVAQPALALSTAPCVTDDGEVEPRLIDLRAFALACPDGFRLAPCALTRFAAEGSAKVNSSAGGGAKDTWVLA